MIYIRKFIYGYNKNTGADIFVPIKHENVKSYIDKYRTEYGKWFRKNWVTEEIQVRVGLYNGYTYIELF